LSPCAIGVPQHASPIEPLPDVGSAEAVCSQNHRPNGVAFRLQVRRNKVEPSVGNRRLNLLANDKLRSALRDEAEKLRPQVPLVLRAALLPRRGERLARARARPAFEVLRPREPEGERPPSDPCKEMALGIPLEIIWPHVCDASFIYVPLRD
jgi:hypothetical protein